MAKIYARVPVLIDANKGAAGNPWGVSFMRMFDMSNDSGIFRNAAQRDEIERVDTPTDGIRSSRQQSNMLLPLSGGADAYSLSLEGGPAPKGDKLVPLYEAKMMHIYDHRWGTYEATGEETRDVTTAEKMDPHFEPRPHYWVAAHEVQERLATKGWERGWLLGWRRISGVEKIRTVIASTIPAFAQGDSIFLAIPNLTLVPELIACLTSCLSSLPFDYIARTKMGGTNLSY